MILVHLFKACDIYMILVHLFKVCDIYMYMYSATYKLLKLSIPHISVATIR